MDRKGIRDHSEITPEMEKLAAKAESADMVNSELYVKYNVKRGLRDLNGNGVLAGLTNISEVRAKKVVNRMEVPDDGHLIYRGYEINDLMDGFFTENRFGFEETAYLLLFGTLPTKEQLESFCADLISYRSLPESFTRDIIMKAPSHDMMNTLSRSVLTMYAYDDRADDVSLPNVLRQCMSLISELPMMGIYGYEAYNHYENGGTLIIHQPLTRGTIAENILHLLRPNSQYTSLEARVLDAALVLHMDHGGGNNSAFTTHVVTSSMTDTYSAIAAALCSLKGPRHGGANIRVVRMFDDIKASVHDWEDDEEVSAYLRKLLHGEAFDRSGLIYGVGHAVYSLSDPRAVIFRSYTKGLAEADGRQKEYALYEKVAQLAPQVIAEERKMYKGACVNIDFYSGFVYEMLGIPRELFTPLFAMSRIVGWSSHRIEELANRGKIIRPCYRYVGEDKKYVPLGGRGLDE